jgi:galactose mutarotase-like enzyme
MPAHTLITIADDSGALAAVAPELGGWLIRYARPIAPHGCVEALHWSQEVVDRYPREMYAGNPILFPLASFNRVGDKDHCYDWAGRRYELPQHGFARRLPWNVTARTPDSVTIELRDTPTTRPAYPFSFRHALTYRLKAGRLYFDQTVENLSPEPMPFSTGFHPYLCVPSTRAGRRASCFVELPGGTRFTTVNRHERFDTAPAPAGRLSVDVDAAETFFYGDFERREIRLVDDSSGLETCLNFEGSQRHRFLACWAKTTREPYYCIEPWTALPNVFGRDAREEMILLEPRDTFRAAFWMEVRSRTST